MQNQVGGLSVILGQIEKESKTVIAEIESKAKKESDKIISMAKAEADKITAEAKAAADKAYAAALERDKSAMEHNLSQQLLYEKQKLLDGVIKDAVDDLSGGRDKRYYDFLKSLLGKYAGGASGRILMSEKDIKEMPADFKEYLEKNCPNLRPEVSEKVESGFIAAYDDIDIEENCTLSELADSAMDGIKEKVQRVMFK